MDYEDKEMPCRDCPERFVFTAGEQRFFAEKGFNPPVRCKTCRDRKKGQGQQPQSQTSQAPAPQQARTAPEVYRVNPVRASARVEPQEDFDGDRRRNRRVHKSRHRYAQENDDGYDY